MLLIVCSAGGNRYAIDSRHVSEVLPQANLQRLTGSPPWLAGLLIFRGTTAPVMDLAQLAGGMPCPNRLSARIVILQLELEGITRRFGVLAEQVSLREVRDDSTLPGGETAAPAAFGHLALDDQGVFQVVDVRLLLTADRRAILFPAVEIGS